MASPVVHLRPRTVEIALCGRRVPDRRIHSSWPMCKTCKRAAAAGNWRLPVRWFDADGWLTETTSPPVTGSASWTFTVQRLITRTIDSLEGLRG